ncbi:metallopeptidase M24 family protein, partial [Vibrio parahaemolyticus V-223/04]
KVMTTTTALATV